MLRLHNCFGNLSDALEPHAGWNNVVTLDTNGGDFDAILFQERSNTTTTVDLTFLSVRCFPGSSYLSSFQHSFKIIVNVVNCVSCCSG